MVLGIQAAITYKKADINSIPFPTQCPQHTVQQHPVFFKTNFTKNTSG